MEDLNLRLEVEFGPDVLGEDLIWAVNLAATSATTEPYSRLAVDRGSGLYEAGQNSPYAHRQIRVAPALNSLVIDPRRTYRHVWVLAHRWPREETYIFPVSTRTRIDTLTAFGRTLKQQAVDIAGLTSRSDRLQRVEVCDFALCQQVLEHRDGKPYCPRHGGDKPRRQVWIQLVGDVRPT